MDDIYQIKIVINRLYNIITNEINIYHKTDIYNCIYENELDNLVALTSLINNYVKNYKNISGNFIPDTIKEKSLYNTFNNSYIYLKNIITDYDNSKICSILNSNILDKIFNNTILLFNIFIKRIGYNILLRHCINSNNNKITDMNKYDIIEFCDSTKIPLLDIKQLSKHTFILLCFDIDYYSESTNPSLRETLDYTSNKIENGINKCIISCLDEDLNNYYECNVEINAI